MADRLELQSLSFVFEERGSGAAPLFQDFSLVLCDGEITTLLGPSGCGKTTLLRMIGGLVKPHRGKICLNGEELRGPGRERRIVFQENSCYPWLSVRANIAFGSDHLDSGSEVEKAMQLVGLSSVGHLLPQQLSVGMRQRVGLARALIGGSRVLLLDEPLSALDALTRCQLQRELREMLVGPRRIVLWVTHDVEEALLMGDRVLVLGSRPVKVLFESRPAFQRVEFDEIRFTGQFRSTYRDLIREVRELWAKSD